MTSWQDQQDRGGRSRTAADPAGRPLSRREAREAERRAAEATQERQPHPSGVVDFEAHDFSAEFAPDQDFNVGDTQDIWAALTRGAGRPPVSTGGVPTHGGEAAGDGSAVSGELLDRVRDAVLRRGQEPQAAPRAPQVPAVPDLYDTGVPSAAETGRSRRERRLAEAAEAREDDLPTELFADRGPVPTPAPRRPRGAEPSAYAAPAAPQPYEPQAYEPRAYEPQAYEPQAYEQQAYEAPAQQQAYDDYDDDYYDEPYAPEPTIAIPSLRPMELDPAPGTSPLREPQDGAVALPQSYAEPIGDDALTFSNQAPTATPEPGLDHPEVDSAFVEPRPAAWSLPPRGAPTPPQGSPFLPPQRRADTGEGPRQAPAAFTNPELGPPSEVTDLAGFEALIRKARQQPAQPPQPARPAPMAWADDDEDVQEGFTGLLSRSVQGSHGSANALILPNDPQPDLTQAVTGNGDIFITGSMNLPRRLSTTGTTAEHEAHDVDSYFDDGDDEPAAGVAPVRAARAVSGSVEARAMVPGRRLRGNVLPTVLAVVAGVMAVGVLTLLIGSWALKLF